MVGLVVLDEAEHGGHDNGGEGDERGVAEERRQEEESEEHADGHDDVGHGGLAAGVEVDGGFGEGAGGQVAGGERADDVHQPEGYHLLVAVHLLVLHDGEASGYGDSFLKVHVNYKIPESDDRREIGELSVADSLRDGKAGDGDSGEKIVLEELQIVVG
nr:hypothetical protein PRUPE_7G228400 [Ipomoea batatas]